jgi:hypothetical protein
VLKYVDGQKYEPHFGECLHCMHETFALCVRGGDGRGMVPPVFLG